MDSRVINGEAFDVFGPIPKLDAPMYEFLRLVYRAFEVHHVCSVMVAMSERGWVRHADSRVESYTGNGGYIFALIDSIRSDVKSDFLRRRTDGDAALVNS